MQPGWILGWPGLAFSQGAVQTCREPCLVQPSLELLVWQLCPWEAHHRIILRLFDSSAALLWELSVFGFVLWLVLPAPSWCCWCLCHGAVTTRAFARVTTELCRHLLLTWWQVSWGCVGVVRHSLCLGFVFPQFADRSCLCSRLTCGAGRSLSAQGGGTVAGEQSPECCRDMWGVLLLEEAMHSCRSKNRCPSEQLWVRSHPLAEF